MLEAQSARGHSCQAQAGDIEMTVRRERETASLRCALMRSGDTENIFREGRGASNPNPTGVCALCSLKSSGEPELSGGKNANRSQRKEASCPGEVGVGVGTVSSRPARALERGTLSQKQKPTEAPQRTTPKQTQEREPKQRRRT